MGQLSKEAASCLKYERERFQRENGRAMLPTDGPFHENFEGGAVECDEPPGLMERYYQLWLSLGGVVTPPKPVTMDDL